MRYALHPLAAISRKFIAKKPAGHLISYRHLKKKNKKDFYLRQRNFHFAEKENVNGVSISCFAIPRKSINRIKEKYFQKSNNLQLL